MDSHADTVSSDLRRVLSGAGLKLTHQRTEIWRALQSLGSHPTVMDVFEEVRGSLPSISLDTVYRTLWTFSGLGLLDPVSTHGDAVRFDSTTLRHHHFLCTRCGRILDFQDPRLDALEIPESSRRLGVVIGYQVEVRGICAECTRSGHETAVPGGPRKGDRNV